MIRLFTFLMILLITFQAQAQCWRQVAVEKGFDGGHTLAIATNGTLWAFGANNYGQLGDGSTTNRSLPVPVGADNDWAYVAASPYASYGIKTDGTLWSWGSGSYSVLGTGATSNQLTPGKVGIATNWKTVSASGTTVVALKTDGTLWRWGSDGFANGSPYGMATPLELPVPTQFGTDADWVSIERGNSYTMGLKANGSRWGSGALINGVGGTGVQDVGSAFPIQLDAGPWKSISLGTHVLGIKSDGSLWGWGTNHNGQIGNGTTGYSVNTPALIDNTNSWQSVNATPYRATSFAIRSDQTLWSWGGENPGYIRGTGNTSPSLVPAQVGTNTNWVSVQATSDHVAGIRSDNTLWTWGRVGFGQLGNGATSSTGEAELNPIRVNCSQSLPVRLQRFSVVEKDAAVELSWITATEKNSNRFEIQRSTDGESWTTIGLKKAKGESNVSLTYRFSDSYPVAGINYYRLKMIDHDETFDYSRIESVEVERGTALLYPNPVADKLFLKNVDAATVREVILQNLNGLPVLNYSGFPSAGLDVQAVQKGVYLLIIKEYSGYSKAYKVMVVR